MATHAADLSEINPHLGLWQSESFESFSERAYYRWLRQAEKKLAPLLAATRGSLDGNQGTDGYSLDEACDIFDSGCSVDDYVAEIRQNIDALDAAFGPVVLA